MIRIRKKNHKTCVLSRRAEFHPGVEKNIPMQQSCGSPAEKMRVLSAGPEPGLVQQLVQQTSLAMFRAPGRSAA